MQPIILQGQVYLHETLNEYVVVKSCLKGLVTYAGHGLGGMMDYERFMEIYGPVNPDDLTPVEAAQLCIHLPETVKLSTGWVATLEDGLEFELDDDCDS
jgi:hypothetical protein